MKVCLTLSPWAVCSLALSLEVALTIASTMESPCWASPALSRGARRALCEK